MNVRWFLIPDFLTSSGYIHHLKIKSGIQNIYKEVKSNCENKQTNKKKE